MTEVGTFRRTADVGEFRDRVAVVTGGSRGLGRAIVLAFAERGAGVVIASRKGDACRRLADEVTSRYGCRAEAVTVNVSSWQDCDRLADEAYERFGRVDILVNNAGVSPQTPTSEGVSDALFDKVIAVNLRGPFRLMSLIGWRMARESGGSIVNISSTAAVRPTPQALPYAAAKAGLNALTEGFAHELAPRVRVNSIMCGMFRTDVAKAWGDPAAVEAFARKRTDLGRVGEPSEVVGAALFFASDASSFCTGTTLRLDGGLK